MKPHALAIRSLASLALVAGALAVTSSAESARPSAPAHPTSEVGSPAKAGTSAQWYWAQYGDGASAPYSDVPYMQPLGNECYYLLNFYWIMLPGPVVDTYGGTRTTQSPDHVGIATDAGYNDPYVQELFHQLGLQASSGGQLTTGPEYVEYVPWASATPATSLYWSQWMRSLDGYPGKGLQWDFWRITDTGSYDWQPAEFGFAAVGNVYQTLISAVGTNQEWDAITFNGPGTYYTGGYLNWGTFSGSSFPGLSAEFEMNDPTTCLAATAAQRKWSKRTGKPVNVTGPNLATKTDALDHASPPPMVSANARLAHVHVYRTRAAIRSVVQPGHFFGLADYALHLHSRTRVKGGHIECEAKVGRHIVPNHHRMLRPRFRRAIHRLHRSHGFNACIWWLPRHSHAQRVVEHLDVITKHGASELTVTARVRHRHKRAPNLP